jgi:hypothetical protein
MAASKSGTASPTWSIPSSVPPKAWLNVAMKILAFLGMILTPLRISLKWQLGNFVVETLPPSLSNLRGLTCPS